MLGAGALGLPRGMVWGGRREEGSGWGTQVYLWQIHVDIWQNQYNIVKLKNKIKLNKRTKNWCENAWHWAWHTGGVQRVWGSACRACHRDPQPLIFCLLLPHSLHMPRFLSSKSHTFFSKLYPKKPPCSLTFACFTP